MLLLLLLLLDLHNFYDGGRIWFHENHDRKPVTLGMLPLACTNLVRDTLVFEHCHNTRFLATARGSTLWTGHSCSALNLASSFEASALFMTKSSKTQ